MFCVTVAMLTAVALESITSDSLSLLGLKQRMKKGWQTDRAFMRESRDWRNWPLSVGTCLWLSVWACVGNTHHKTWCQVSNTEANVSLMCHCHFQCMYLIIVTHKYLSKQMLQPIVLFYLRRDHFAVSSKILFSITWYFTWKNKRN